jgi:hypothetical protein
MRARRYSSSLISLAALAPLAELMGFGPVEAEEGRGSFVGTIDSGWLTDRYHSRKLLAVYYSLRGLSLLLLPFVTDFAGFPSSPSSSVSTTSL